MKTIAQEQENIRFLGELSTTENCMLSAPPTTWEKCMMIYCGFGGTR